MSIDAALTMLGNLQPTSDIEGFNRLLATISRMIFPDNLRLYYARVDDLREQDVNAQSMTKKMFDQLTENIKEAGVLESLPLCATIEPHPLTPSPMNGEGEKRNLTPGPSPIFGEVGNTIWVVSGHHRKRALAAAGVQYTLVLLYEGLTWDRVRSKQLAHNSIFGKSDPELVKRIWDKIEDVRARFEAFIDPRMFENIPAQVSFKPVDVNMNHFAKTVVIAFLPVQHGDFEAALEKALPKGEVDKVYLAAPETYDLWMEALKRTREGLDVVAVPSAVAAMARLAIERLDQMAQVDSE